jgi:eukaryotic-like serine/threonine-protein kinase
MNSPWEDDPALLVDGKYFLEAEIGHGGMGRVWRALQVGLQRRVAVKFLEIRGERGTPSTPEEQREAIQRFEREAHALAKLAHPGIVQVFEYGVDAAAPYIAMELVEGRSLAEVAKDGLPLAAAQVARWGIELAACLEHAHARGVLHRDIKPSNVLLDAASGRVRLLDFGIARALRKDASMPTLTRVSQVAGTPGFLAPESLLGAEPAIAQDVYALGGTLYALAQLVAVNDVDRPALLQVLAALRAHEPTARPLSMGAVQAALTQVLVVAADKALAGAAPTVLAPTTFDDAESTWRSAMALLCTTTTSIGLWAVVLGLTPKVVTGSELLPLTYLINEPLPDGRLVSLARFETGPVLAFVVALSISMLGFGFLRAYWARHPLALPAQTRSAASRCVLALGVAMVAIHVVRVASEQRGSAFFWPIVARYVAPIGGVMELAMLFGMFRSLLHNARVRSSRIDWRLVLGVLLSLLPPTHAFYTYLRAWKP